uniref:Uncharacterized protein n=1 Tax=Arundo donax TaxID=35708 RepID=A0A0A9ELQ3_ARUDO
MELVTTNQNSCHNFLVVPQNFAEQFQLCSARNFLMSKPGTVMSCLELQRPKSN